MLQSYLGVSCYKAALGRQGCVPGDVSWPCAELALSAPGAAQAVPAPQAAVSAFSNGVASAFSPIQPVQGAGMGVSAASAFSMGRQPSETWNVCLYVPFVISYLPHNCVWCLRMLNEAPRALFL